MKDASIVKDIQKNNIIASNAVTNQQRDFSKFADDICEENLVYLRIRSISDNLPFNYETNKPQFKSHSRISQSLSQDCHVTCIVSKVWTWERIQEEISSALMQHLGCIPLTHPQKSFQKYTCFYHYSKDESQRQSIPLPTLPKCDVQMISKDNSRTMDIIENYVKIEGNCPLSQSFILYPILHRMDFWNAIYPFESFSTNTKWAVDMVVFCQPSKPLQQLHQHDKVNLSIHDFSLDHVHPIKIKESVQKRKYHEGLGSESSGMITIRIEPEGGEKPRQRIVCESVCPVATELQGQLRDTFMQSNFNHCEDLIEPAKRTTKEMNDIVCGNHKNGQVSCPSELSLLGPHVNKATKGKGSKIKICLREKGICHGDTGYFIFESTEDFLIQPRNEKCRRQEQQKQLTLNSKRRCTNSILKHSLSRNVPPSPEYIPLTRIDSTTSCDNENKSLDFGHFPESICPQDQTLTIGTSDSETSTISIDDNGEKGANQSEMSNIWNLGHNQKVKKDGKTMNNRQHKHKEVGRQITTTLINCTPECIEKAKIRKERNKKTVPEYSGIHPYDVICYPKQAGLKNIGNRRLDILVEMAASHYNAAMDKAARSKVVESVVDTIHEAGGNFVRCCQIRGYVAASQFLACLIVGEKFDEALVFRGRPSQERTVYEILKVQDKVTA